jgi:PAS domain S-box-containing protein
MDVMDDQVAPGPPAQGWEDFAALVSGVSDYAVALLDREARIITWNRGGFLATGYTSADIVGQHYSRLHTREAIRAGVPVMETGRAARDTGFQEEGWRERRDGSRFWASVSLTALRDHAGGLSGYLTIIRDLTQRRAMEEALRESEERFRLMVEGVVDYAIFLLDIEGRVVTWNAGAERIKGYRAEDILGRHFSVFYPPQVADRGWPEHELARATVDGRFEDEGWRVRQDGSRFWADVVITALRDAQGKLQGFAKVTRDLTERRGAEDALRAAQADLERRVQERTAELAAVNRDLQIEAGKRDRLQAELTRHIVALHERDRSRNEFLATLAHELRNPLAPIRSAAEVLKQTLDGQPAASAAQGIVARQVAHMSRLVDDLVDVSRITRDSLDLRRERIRLDDVVAAAVETARPMLAAQSLDLVTSLPPEPVVLDADPARLSQALANLLNNAAKFTPAGGRVWLTVERRGRQVRLAVRDDGIGIAPEELGRIFQMFEQGQRAPGKVKEGLGIGLTLVKRLVELHGGTVEARSAGLGRGSEFVIELASAEDAGGADAEAAAEAVPEALPARVRVVVADDNHDAAQSMAMMLELMGAQAEAVFDGQEALDAAARSRPDLAILDLGMPRLGGEEVARCIRSAGWGGEMVLVALTGWGQDEDRQRSLDAGFDHHLVKPVDAAAIRRLLVEVAARRR